MKRKARLPHRSLATALVTLPLLAACGGGSVTPTVPAASAVTLGGVRVLDANTYQLGISALDAKSAVVTTGTFKTPTVSSLSAGQATVSVCGQIQKQDVLTTAITMDSTGSMTSTDPDNVRQQAAQTFVNRMSSSDRAAVLSFDTSTSASSGLKVARLWQDFTSDKTLLGTGVSNATFAGGGTPLYDAVGDGLTVLGKTTGSNKNVLVLTDGADNSSASTPTDVIASAKASGVRVFAVGLDATGTLDFTSLENIASQTGGLFQEANDATQLRAFFDNMYNALTAQGCLQLAFTTKPATGTDVTGSINFVVSDTGKVDAPQKIDFRFTVR